MEIEACLGRMGGRKTESQSGKGGAAGERGSSRFSAIDVGQLKGRRGFHRLLRRKASIRS